MTRPRHRRTVGLLLAATAGMFAFGFLLVPLYDVFCEITGLNGKTGGRYAPAATDVATAAAREVEVQFVAINNAGMPWTFRPSVARLTVKVGETHAVSYRVHNPTVRSMIAQAIPSVSPGLGAAHLRKIECFCFQQQRLEPGASEDMELRFMIDPALPTDIRTLTLAYTLFDRTAEAARAAAASAPEGNGNDT